LHGGGPGKVVADLPISLLPVEPKACSIRHFAPWRLNAVVPSLKNWLIGALETTPDSGILPTRADDGLSAIGSIW
jgi:hypothetical protein